MSSEVKKDAGPNVAAGKKENVKQEPATPQGANQSAGGPRGGGRGGNFGGRGVGRGRGGRGGFNNQSSQGANKRDSPAPGASRGNLFGRDQSRDCCYGFLDFYSDLFCFRVEMLLFSDVVLMTIF